MVTRVAAWRMAMSIACCLGLAAASVLLFSFEFSFDASAAHAQGLRSAASLVYGPTGEETPTVY
jgi:hypothetical protein